MAAATAAIIGAAIIGAASSSYQAERAREAENEQQKKLEEERYRQEQEARRIAENTRPDQESVQAIEFGTGSNDIGGSVDDFLVQKPKGALGGTSGKSGLGFI